MHHTHLGLNPNLFKDIKILLLLNQNFITKFKNLKNRNLEKYEGIELLRILENGFKIGTIKFKNDSFSINAKRYFEVSYINSKR